MSNIVNNYCSTLVTIFLDVKKNYERNTEIIKECEETINDLNHEIELSEPKNAYQGYLLYKEIRELRIRRRTAKNENELMKDMYDYLISQQGQQFKNKIQQIQGASAKVQNAQETRTYTPRQKDNLTITDRTCETNKPFEELLKDFKKTKVEIRGGKLRK